MHGVGSAVHTWTQQALQSKHDETQLCGPCWTSPGAEGHIRKTDRMARALYQQISQLRTLARSVPLNPIQ